MERKLTTDKNFFLKQVDPITVVRSYLAGTLILPNAKIKFDSISLTPDLEVGTDYNSPVYEISDKNGEIMRIVTTDHDKWIIQDKSQQRYICYWCRIENSGEWIIIPIKIDRTPHGKLIFSGTGSYCCFECAYADLKTKWYCNYYYRDALYVDAETLLRFMYFSYTGKLKLTASSNWILHQKNGGKLSDKDFYNDKHTYVALPNIILNQIKTTYVQTNK